MSRGPNIDLHSSLPSGSVSAMAAPARPELRGRPRIGVLRILLIAAAAVPTGASLLTPSDVPGTTRALVTLLWILSLSPAYFYVSTPVERRRPLPFLPVVSVLYGLYYALPLTLGITDQYFNAPVDPRTDYDLAVDLALFGWFAMMAAYHAVGGVVRDRRLTPKTSFDPLVLRRWSFAFLFAGLLLSLLRVKIGDSSLTGGIFQFATSLEWFGAGAIAMLGRRGYLSNPGKVIGTAGIVAAAGIILAGGSIAPLVMLVATVGFGLWIGRPSLKLTWILAAVSIALFAMSLRGVAIEFRKAAWFGSAQLTQSDRMMLMLKLLEMRSERDGVMATVANGVATTGGRSAVLDLFANVASRTPSEVPYWNGVTYVSLVGSFVPRVLWPDKPTKELGQAFGHRYRLIYWTNTSTAINLPFLVEFFINFSTAGVVLGMMLVGLIYRVLDAVVNRPLQDPLVSLLGVVLLLPLLLIESDFSLIFGGLPLNALALYGVWALLTGRLSRFVQAGATGRAAAGAAVRPAVAVPVMEDRSRGASDAFTS